MAIPLAQLQRLMERQGQVTGFSVIMKSSSDKAAIDAHGKEIESLAQGLDGPAHRRTRQERYGDPACQGDGLAHVGGRALDRRLRHDEHDDHGRSRANEGDRHLARIGWGRGRIVRMILLEVAGDWRSRSGRRRDRRQSSGAALDPGANGRGLIDGRIEPRFFVYGLLLALGVGLVGGLLPAYRASRLLPTVALRYE